MATNMTPLFDIHNPEIPIVGESHSFPVRRVYCVGRNYAAHAREMGFDPDRDPPFFFCKPASAIVYCPPGEAVDCPYPVKTSNFHHEIELVVAIGSSGKDVPIAQANELIYGYGLGLDMTRRDLQISMRDIGRPWEIGKAFDNGAPLGQIYPRSTTGLIESGTIAVSVGGETRQNSNVTHLIWSIPEIISNLSTLFELQSGDIIYTGTPDGVGHVNAGEQLIGSMQGLADISITYG